MVKHPSADLSGLPEMLGLRAARIWRVGEPRVTPKGNPLDGLYQHSYCGLYIEHHPGVTLPKTLLSVADHLRPNADKIRTLCTSGGRFLLNVYWHSAFNTGEEFDPPVLVALANMNLALGIDVYCDNDSSSAEP